MARASDPILALDFGGTKISAATVAPGDGEWESLERRLSPPGGNAQSDLRTALELSEKLLGERKPSVVGVSFGGPVWAASGTVRLSHHVPGWERMPLGRTLQDHFGVPVAVENDGIVAALGEYRYGAGGGAESLVYLTVSTGVGGGIILNGQIWRGGDGMAGHIGHLRLEPDGPPCVCGSRGCLESIASGPSIAAEARRRIELHPERGNALLQASGGDASRLDAKTIAGLAAAGDELAHAVMRRAAWALGAGIGSAANLLNPTLFLVGGGVSKAGPVLWDEMRRVARETAMPEVTLELAPAGLGDDAPLWGAVALATAALSSRPEAQGSA